MPFIVAVNFLIAIFFAVHAVKTEQDRYWLFIMFSFPFLGSAVYFFTVFLPSFRDSYTGQIIESRLKKALRPERELRVAEQDFELSATVENRLKLAKALMDNNRAKDAISHYQAVLDMPMYKTSPDVLLEYAYALFLADEFIQAKQQLDYLREQNPAYQSNEGHLLYANILVKLDDKSGATREFTSLMDYYPTLEAHCSYAEALLQWGEKDKAKQLLASLETHIKRLPPHVKRYNAVWINRIKQLYKMSV
ncbi:MAG TPA: hypothetical protein DD638_05065 [Pasteurellaceae bacterium]|nr:hypothetical protein [Pasteurellaceae bacterium]